MILIMMKFNFFARRSLLSLITGVFLLANLMISPLANAWIYPFDKSDISQMANSDAGRYIYTGVVPRFQSEDLELTASKIGLTLRVKAWVTPELIDAYLRNLLLRWSRINETFSNDAYFFLPFKSYDSQFAKAANQPGQLAWLTVVSDLFWHTLNINSNTVPTLPAVNSSSKIRNDLDALYSLEILRHFLSSPDATVETAADLLSKRPNDTDLVEYSRALFFKHLGGNFTKSQGRGPKYLGYLTFVYPVAAATTGPMSNNPKEGFYRAFLPGSMGARTWSDKWGDSFGGFPFFQITSAGHAFHGPITKNNTQNIWYLQRGYVSHGCNRMDESDVMELRAMLPRNYGSGIPLVLQTWPDITDWNDDGRVEVMDVQYYEIPSAISAKAGITKEELATLTAPYRGKNAQQQFWKNHFQKYRLQADPLRTNDLLIEGSENIVVNSPKYKVQGGNLIRDGVYERAPIHSFGWRGIRVLQYRDTSSKSSGYDDKSPQYFNYP